MRITSIIENTSNVGMPVEHGLSLYIQLANGQRVLFDMGQGRLFAENAERLGLSIADVDTAIISHGHYDHGGGLQTFLELNDKAKVYIHKDAFRPHYSLRESGMAYIGLAPLHSIVFIHPSDSPGIGESNPRGGERITLCESQTYINGNMTLFADVHGDCCRPLGNRLLFEGEQNDAFSHEQNLIIREGSNTILFAGCAHNGIINIIRKAEEVIGHAPTHVFGGMHLKKSGLSEQDEDAFIATLANELMKYSGTQFYTMHCTGTEQYEKLRTIMGLQIDYLSCGETAEFLP